MKAYETVIQHVERGILDGALAVGARLPPERELAAELGVSRSAVREAIRSLESQGVVTSSVGAGPDGGTTVTSQRSEALARLLTLHVALARYPVEEVVETRVALERTAVALAAERIGPDDRARLVGLTERMADPGLAPEEFNALDSELHVLLAEAGGNLLVRDLTAAVRESLRRPILDAERALPRWEPVRAALHDAHLAIARAVLDGDGARAADLVEAHIRDAYSVLPITLPITLGG